MRPTFRGVHARFLADESPEIDLEGSRMSGKTWVCCAKIIESCLKHPGIWWLICRYSNEETKTMVRPVFEAMCQRYGVEVAWYEEEQHFVFPEKDGKVSKVFAHGLKSQTKEQELAKVRGLDVAGVWLDQAEECPQLIADELPFGTRQSGYPHQLIFSPNPPPEDHYLTDRFPEECAPDSPKKPFEHRVYYHVALSDNAHNLPEQKIKEIEDAFPVTHAKFKSLVLGQRGVNVSGVAVYLDAFRRDLHLSPDVKYDRQSFLLESIESGRHHPVWIAAQRTYTGGWNVLGGILGKRMFLEDFLPIVERYRSEWFDDPTNVKLCCDPPPAQDSGAFRYNNIRILREANLKPRFRANGNAPDVREAIIQTIAAHMKRRVGNGQAFNVTNDPERWLTVSSAVNKQGRWFVDALEGAYVWSENLVSVANKRVREPKTNEWIEGGMRCLENIVLNFGAAQKSDAEKDEQSRRQREQSASGGSRPGGMGWLGF